MEKIESFQIFEKGDKTLWVTLDVEKSGVDFATLQKQVNRSFILSNMSVYADMSEAKLAFSPGLSHITVKAVEFDEVTDKTKWFVVFASIVLMTAFISVAFTVMFMQHWN